MGFAVEQVAYTTQLHTLTCGACGTPFAMEERLYRKKAEEHAEFYCPNGHCRQFCGKTEAQKLRELLDEQARKYASELNLRLAAETELNYIKKRISRGVCPCCKRSFSNVHRHIEQKHPNFKK